ncbi:MAG TPA: SDR family oxidoreductase [Burkholderiales bacterium]|nr:SDR family oxidoreductase [Burkholderiales bacterium]
MPRTAFVTGATGFVGLNLVEQLLAQGWRVLALHRAGAELKYLSRMAAERVAGDITDARSVLDALPEGIDAVFHVAGDTNLWSRNNAAQDRVNIDGTRNVVHAALERRARRFLHTSSISAYGLQRGRLDERTPQRGKYSKVNYNRSKHLAEEAVRAGIARGLDAVILNPGAILGPYDTRNYARLVTMVAGGTLPGVPPGALPFCHVREVARAHIAAFERGRTGENYLLGGTDARLLELVQAIGGALGKPVPSRPTPAWVLRILGALGALRGALSGKQPALTPETALQAARELSCDSAKAMRELGYRAVPLREMVADCVGWLAAEGRLPGVQSARLDRS